MKSKILLFIFIFLLPSESAPQDLLIDYMRYNWINDIDYNQYRNDDKKEYEDNDTSIETSEAEAFSWDLGTPDNIPEIEIIYSNSSNCYCR